MRECRNFSPGSALRVRCQRVVTAPSRIHPQQRLLPVTAYDDSFCAKVNLTAKKIDFRGRSQRQGAYASEGSGVDFKMPSPASPYPRQGDVSASCTVTRRQVCRGGITSKRFGAGGRQVGAVAGSSGPVPVELRAERFHVHQRARDRRGHLCRSATRYRRSIAAGAGVRTSTAGRGHGA